MNEIIDTLYFIKMKTFYSAKDNVKEWEDKPQTGRKYLQKTRLIKTVIQNIQRTLKTQQ